MKKKGIAIVGSPRKENSISRRLCKKLFQQIQDKYTNFDYEIVMLPDLKLHKCIGCCKCFEKCQSCVSFHDDIQILENKILDSDLILFASPVYAHNITGDMKIFFDRISYWLHLLRLAGRYGINISVSSSNGNMFVDQYLEKMMEFLGISIIGNISFGMTLDFDMKIIDELVEKTIYYFKSNEPINCELKNKVFKVYKDVYQSNYLKYMQDNSVKIAGETKFWLDNGYLECNSFEELFYKFT